MAETARTGQTFTISKTNDNGRLGVFSFTDRNSIHTPFLFPVAFLMTGTTARGGATWKYILQEQEAATKQHTLLRRNSPVLSQALHFLDYRLSPNGLQNWRNATIRGLYKEQVADLDYQAPIFLDSGGFKLMWRTGLDLSKYGICLDPGEEAKSILQLQKDLGGDIVATLDYPLPPNLDPAEIPNRTTRSLENAIQAAKLLRDDAIFEDFAPFLYMAVHGLSSEAMTDYVERLFQRIEEEELGQTNFGLAIGSLVPLRKDPNMVAQVISIIKAAVAAIPEKYKGRVPVHVFGATGLLVPFLAHVGVDTFDSSTFAQEARSLRYLLPDTFQRRNIMEMTPDEVASCHCPICQNMNLDELKDSLISEIVGQRQASGHYKSKYYADIALHNLELDLDILKQTRKAIEQNELDKYLLKIAKDIPRMQTTLATLLPNDQELQRKATQFIQPVPKKPIAVQEEPARYISLKHTPDDFNINSNGYQPTGGKPVLLIIPCSREKPYSKSHSHKHLSTYLEESLPNWHDQIDKVTLSGLYGPVPQDYESDPAILSYDFRLITSNRKQIELCVERLVEFLERHGKNYEHCIAYGTSSAYRTVFEKTAQKYQGLEVMPVQPKSRQLREFFRIKHITELIEYLQTVTSSLAEYRQGT
jgi:7-cyano-7-deazaguanine tRNA-ribosyltransferase